MRGLLLALFYALSLLGGFGLLLIGILDSSFLFMPLGNDLLMLAMTAEKPRLILYFAGMAATGSTLGSALIDWISRKGGKAGLEKMMSRRRAEFVRKRVEKHAGWAVALAAIMPPPFPFTPVIAGAAAFQYPRRRLLAIVAVMRMVRFTLVGLLAMFFGAAILRATETPAVQVFLVTIVVISVIGSILSVWSWIRRSRDASPTAAPSHALLLLLLVALPASAQDGRLEVAISGWRADTSGRIQAGDLPVDLANDLGVTSRWQFLGNLVVRPGERHAIVLEGSPIALEGTNQLNRSVVYAGRSYQVRDTVDSEATLAYFYGGYRFDVVRRGNGFAAFQVGGAYLDAEGAITSRTANVTASKGQRVGLPLAGAAGRAWLTRMVHLDGDVKGMALGRYGHFVNGSVRAGVALGRVSFLAGYSFLNANIHEADGLTGADLSLRGPTVSVLLRLP